MFKKLAIGSLAGLLLLSACGQKTMDKDMKSDSMKKDKMSEKSMKKDKMSDKSMKKDKMSDKSMKKDKMSDKSMKKDKMSTSHMMNKGEMAADFTLMDVDGQTHRLSDYKGKKVVLEYWASWCSICLSTLESTNELSKMNGEDVVVLTVVTPEVNGEKNSSEFKKWFKTLDYKNMKVLLDEKGTYADKLGVRGYPSFYFIGSDGVLVKQHPGYMEKKEILKELDSIK